MNYYKSYIKSIQYIYTGIRITMHPWSKALQPSRGRVLIIKQIDRQEGRRCWYGVPNIGQRVGFRLRNMVREK